MKVLLIVTLIHSSDYSFDVLRYEVSSFVQCQIQGAALAKDILSKIPGVDSINYTCVEKGYGR